MIDKFSEVLEFWEFAKDDSIAVIKKDMGNGQKTIVAFSNYKKLDSVVLEENDFIDYTVASVVLEELEGMNSLI